MTADQKDAMLKTLALATLNLGKCKGSEVGILWRYSDQGRHDQRRLRIGELVSQRRESDGTFYAESLQPDWESRTFTEVKVSSGLVTQGQEFVTLFIAVARPRRTA